MTAASLSFNSRSFRGWRASDAVSEDAERLGKWIRSATSELLGNVALGEPLANVLGDLERVVRECSVKNWDGYGALPVDPYSLAEACRLLEGLPTTLPVPEVSVDPDGEIALDWIGDENRRLSVSVGGSGLLKYAAILGIEDSHGHCYLTDEIPAAILENLRRVFPETAAAGS